jgi:hypothetical protein
MLRQRGQSTTTSVGRQLELETELNAMELRLVMQRVASSSSPPSSWKNGTAVDRLKMIAAILLLAAFAATSVGRSASSHLITGEHLSSF